MLTMKRIFLLLIISLIFAKSYSQKITNTTPTTAASNFNRPKLVVGIVIDQMRWDYLYRFYPLFKDYGGFKRFLNGGFSCENTFVPYTPTVTAAGHSCVYTGSIPAIHGVMGNEWYDRLQQKAVYCNEDNNVNSVGSN